MAIYMYIILLVAKMLRLFMQIFTTHDLFCMHLNSIVVISGVGLYIIVTLDADSLFK